MWVQGIFISHSSATADKNNAVDAPISKDIILILSMDWYNVSLLILLEQQDSTAHLQTNACNKGVF
jgi:hypothetical protein